MTSRPDPKDSILRGALEALARYGSRRFSMSLVAEEAGVSRATLYRYFPTKEALLDDLTGHIGRDFRTFLSDEISAAPNQDELIGLVVEVMQRYTAETSVLTHILAVEPLFVRNFYEVSFDDLVRDVVSAIGPAFGVTGRAASRRSDVLTAAELLVRMAMSYRVVDSDGGPQKSGAFTKQLAELLQRSVRSTSSA